MQDEPELDILTPFGHIVRSVLQGAAPMPWLIVVIAALALAVWVLRPQRASRRRVGTRGRAR